MGVIKRQGIQNTIISYAGMILGFLNIVFLMPNILKPDQVGLTKLLVTVSAMFAQFSALGFTSVAFKFFPHYRDKANQHQGFFFMLLTVPLVGFALVSAVFLIFKPFILKYYAKQDADVLLQYYNYIFLLGFFSLFYILQDAYLKSLYKTVVSSFVQDFLLRVLTTISVTIYAVGWLNFEQFVHLYIGINCATALILTAYLIYLKQFFIRPNWLAFKVRPLKEILNYGLFAFIGNISTTLNNNIDILMILHYLGTYNVGIFQTAYFVTSAIRIPANSILKIVVQQVSDYWSTNDLTALKSIYQRVTSINLVLGLLLFIGIWANIDNIFSFMPEVYRKGKYVFFFIGMARLFDMATGINGVILLTSEKYRYDLFFNILLAVLTVITNLIFVPVYGLNGAAFASMITIVGINLARLIFVWAIYKMQPFVWRSLLIVVIGIVTYYASLLLPVMPNFMVDIMLRSVLISVIYGVLILTLNASPDASAFWQNLKRRWS